MTAGFPGDEAALRDWLVRRIAELTGQPAAEIEAERPIEEYGLASRDAVMLSGELEELTGEELPPTLLWESPTVAALARRLGGDEDAAQAVPARAAPGDADAVAIVGLGCRFPGGAEGPDRFWELLVDGRDAVTDPPPDRPSGSGERPGGYLPDVAGFDAEFFGIAPTEAELMDPQQRLLLEVAWEALEDAGIAPASLAGSRTGVFAGLATHDYALRTLADPAAVDPWATTGAAGSIAANRLSYLLDLRGPSITVDTACSSSLVAVHQAAWSLRAAESDTALACGVNLLLSDAPTAGFERGGALAADGRCKAFAAGADGIARGEGCGVVVLKRLADARRDGDRVLAVVRGGAVNSDGRSNGLTAPNPAAQRALLADAYRAAGVDPSDVDYVEAHGTGTLLGDPIEASALGAVAGAGRPPGEPLLLGSVKTNLGHTEAAAGVAGLIKVVLAMAHGRIPPSLHYAAPNPHIDFAAARLRVVTEPCPWPRAGRVARAGVSGFGFGGTNAHLVLEGPAAEAEQPRAQRPHVAVLSARSPERLAAAAGRLAAWLRGPVGRHAAAVDIAHTLARRHSAAPHRAAVVAATADELAEAFDAVAGERAGTGDPARPGVPEGQPPGPVFVFSGYGSQWTGMGRDLLAAEPAFAAAVDELDPHFDRHAGFSLRKVLESGEPIQDLDRVQTVLFGIQVALAGQWRALGVRPAAVIGHSLGEVAAAVVSGALSTEDGVRVIAVRSRLLASLNERGGGAMAAVELSADELAALAPEFPDVRVAVYGSPRQLTVAGEETQVRGLLRHVEGSGRTARLLPVSGAGHTEAVAPVLDELAARLATVAPEEPAVPCYGTVYGDPRARPAFDAGYWVEHARRPVRFAQAAAAAAADGHTAFLEVSPHPIAAGALARTATAAGVAEPAVAVSLRRGQDGSRTLRNGLAELYRAGVPVDVGRDASHGRVVSVPGAGWRHRRFWYDPPRPAAAAGDPVLGVHVELPGGRHVWQRPGGDGAPGGERLARAAACTVFGDDARVTAGGGAPPERATLLTTTVTVRGAGTGEVDVHARTVDGTWHRVTAAEVLPPVAGEPPARATPPDAAGALPYEDLRNRLREIVAAVMGFRPAELDETAPLVELGLDSLMAMRIRGAVQRELGITAEPSAVLRGASLRDVAAHLADAAGTPDPVRVLRAGDGDIPPLLLFHPGGGDTEVYRPLLAELPGNLPCYGFDRVPGADVAQRVAHYLPRLRELRPHGPYRLAGWSFGGALAYAMACRLAEAGEHVELVALLDTMLPLPDDAPDPRASSARRFARFARHVERTYGVSVPLDAGELARLPEEEQIETAMRRVAAAGSALTPAVLRHQHASFLDTLAAERAAPRPYDGPVVLYRASEPYPEGLELEPRYSRTDRAAGWDALCPDLRVVPVEGTHLSIVDPPAVGQVAADLAAALRRAEATP